MKTFQYRGKVVTMLMLVALVITNCRQDLPQDLNHLIWYEYPGEHWNSQGMHLGNGYFGATFLGGVNQEVISITDASMWTGGPANGDWEKAGVNPMALNALPQIREAVVNGEAALADSLTNEHFLGDSELYGYFTSIGDLLITFSDHGDNYTAYSRALDLQQSTGQVKYQIEGIEYVRDYFCSFPDKVLVLQYTSNGPDAINLKLAARVVQDSSSIQIEGNTFQVRGFINGNNRPFNVMIRVKNQGGTVENDQQVLKVSNADTVTLYVTMSTNYKMEYPHYTGQDPEVTNSSVLTAALAKDYQQLKQAHIQDYRNLYDRVKLDLEHDRELAAMPTDQRFERLKAGKQDTGYKILAFNLGRYMVISASRPGTLPANLQGVWNVFKFAPWAGNYQSNINLQEIYWSCGPLNLPECQQSYIDWIENLAISGREIAKRVYGTNGWISHTIGNIWGHAAPTGALIWGMYSMGSAWHCQHVWDQFAFNQDTDYLEHQAYPLLKDASVFWLENLIPFEGYYITSPTVSAEHGALLTDNGLNPAYHDLESDQYRYSLPGVYQDMEMIWDLFTNTAQAAYLLGDDQFGDTLLQVRETLLPLKIGKHGQLQEWFYDIDHPQGRHRHIAHLYAVAPGRQIHPTITPNLAAAAATSLNMRGDGRFMDQELAAGGNWARAHRMWAWTRLLDGNRANKIMSEMLTEQGFENVLTYQHAPYGGEPEMYRESDEMFCHFQLDGSAALSGCIAEMIVQSHLDEIHLLPALPDEFSTGQLEGVRARGGYTLDIQWRDGKLIQAKIWIDDFPLPKVRLENQLIDIEKDQRIQIITS